MSSRLVNKLTPSLIKVWENARKPDKTAVQQASAKGVTEKLMRFFLLVRLSRPDPSDTDAASADDHV